MSERMIGIAMGSLLKVLIPEAMSTAPGPESEAMLDTTAQESMWVFRGETLWPGIEADKITTLCLTGFVEQSRQVGSRLHVKLY